jgi:hypothetical protein
MRRSAWTTLIVLVVLVAVAAPLWAADTAEIQVGGGLVARLRDKGSSPTVELRAAEVDKVITEIISTKDTQHPVITIRVHKGLWRVYAWNLEVLSVYAGDAKANHMTEKAIAESWAKNLRLRLPLSTPVSKLPPDQLRPAPAGTKPPLPTPPPAPVKPATTATAPTGTKPPISKPATTTTAPLTTGAKPVGNESGALLLIIDALRTAREMNEQDWTTHKEHLARELYANLSYYLTGKGVPPKLPALKPPAKPAAKPKGKHPAVKPTKPTKPVKPASKPLTTKPPVVKPVAPKPAADASTARVPQKARIRDKFTLAKDPYDKLVISNPEAAKVIDQQLKASRQSFAKGDFDEAERLIDGALQGLGVTYTPH